MAFSTVLNDSTTEKMRIDSAGLVGIGTTSPQEKLDISGGNIRLDNQQSLNFATTDGNIGRVKIAGDESSDWLRFHVDNTIRFQIDAASRISLSNNDAGTDNTVFGKEAGNSIESGGNYNTIFGNLAGAGLTNGGEEHNTFIGHNVAATGTMTATADYNTGIGAWVLNDLTSGANNTGLGYDSLAKITSGTQNVAVGALSASTLTTSELNVAIGYQALSGATTEADGNTAVGYESMMLLPHSHRVLGTRLWVIKHQQPSLLEQIIRFWDTKHLMLWILVMKMLR